MRRHGWMKAMGIAIGVLLLTPTATLAGQEEAARMQALEERLLALEDQLSASEETIQAQRQLLDRESPDVAQGSGLDAFFNGLEFGGFVAASYIYNFNNPDNNSGGAFGYPNTLCQFNCNHNTFALDGAKLEIGKAASEPGTAGFQFDLLFGQNADLFQSISTNGTEAGLASGDSDFGVFVQQAYVNYNYNGVDLKMGKFETLLGWELIDSHKNYNVSHGILFTWAIPLFHTGLLASGNLTEEIGWAAGITNGFNNSMDTGDNKGFLGQVSYGSGPFFGSLSTYVGTLEETRTRTSNGVVVGDNNVDTQIYDLVLQFTPNEQLDTWLNVDYGFTERRRASSANADEDPQWFGVAAGFNYTLSEKLSLAMRGEWMHDDGDSRLGFAGATGQPAFIDETDLYSATVTLGYQLTSNLKARLEYRHDVVDCDDSDCNPFDSSDAQQGEDENDIGLFEVVYVFD